MKIKSPFELEEEEDSKKYIGHSTTTTTTTTTTKHRENSTDPESYEESNSRSQSQAFFWVMQFIYGKQFAAINNDSECHIACAI